MITAVARGATSESLSSDKVESIRRAVHDAAHLLPSQGPLEAFVHHNTLHAIEELPFHEAVVEGGALFGCRSYMPEAWYHDHRRLGRIEVADIRAALTRELGDDASRPVGAFGTVLDLRAAMLSDEIRTGSDAEVLWSLRIEDEGHIGDAMFWDTCRRAVARVPAPTIEPRRRQRLRAAVATSCGVDPDDVVDDFLIPFLASFLDQGMARVSLPERDRGLLAAFVHLHRGRRPSVAALATLPAEIERIERIGLSPELLIEEGLTAFGVPVAERDRYVADSLLALRGWAGMLERAEQGHGPFDWTPPHGTLVEYLAIRLLLDRIAAVHLRTAAGFEGVLVGLADGGEARSSNIARAFTVRQAARRLGLTARRLGDASDADVDALVREVDAFPVMARCRVLHEAYEAFLHQGILAAVGVHAPARTAARPHEDRRASLQIVCCIDEREESFRRHIEELAPDAETLGFAGFFGVAMNYRGAGEAHYRALCPVTVQPKHEVVEEPLFAFENASRLQAEFVGRAGAAALRMHHGSRSLVGGAMSGLLGLLATVPLVCRVLMPRTAARVAGSIGRVLQPPLTTLHLEREGDEPGPSGLIAGFTPDEMAGIVEQVLTLMGLREGFARVVIMVGHGSSSMNNPHEAAHDCGACSGGRGGPNARAFAAMANDPRVRARLASRGLDIPADTIFVGAYHNTCDEDVVYYDLDRIPRSHRDEFVRARGIVDEARRRNAHERCRRFDAAPARAGDRAALWHVEARAEDLSQVRPEYGHATNAICLVGRRSWSRGLFLDRRAFLASYDPAVDDENRSVLAGLLGAVIPVCAGISLEYFFSFVDPAGYGCGTKLPHNICGLLGVMDGARSDLRTGLPWQMVEIHEPVRLLAVVECDPESLTRIVHGNPVIRRIVAGEWLRLATIDPGTGRTTLWRDGGFEAVDPGVIDLPRVPDSRAWYAGRRGHLTPAIVDPNAADAWTGGAR